MKKYLIIILTLIVLTGPCLVLAQETGQNLEDNEVEYTIHDGPSDIKEEVENEGEYIYVEKREGLEPGLFENIDNMDNIAENNKEIKTEDQIPGYLDYKSWQFWILVVILLTIISILIRMFKNLSKINTEIKRHENYLKEINTKKRPQISEKDEILYSEPEDE